MKTHIVIPIGVASPGTPDPILLKKSIESIIRQTSKDWILTVASDSNVSEEVKEILHSYPIKIKWFEAFSFFRKGSIWKKIWDCWSEEETTFIAFLHYDDVWHENKLEEQVHLMERENLKTSTSKVFQIDENDKVISEDLSYTQYAKCHSMIIRKKALEKSNLLKKFDQWAAYFEKILMEEVNNIGDFKRSDNAIFFHRVHRKSITNTVSENAEFVKHQTSVTGYTLKNMYEK